jgi:putative zinc finger/helix-turn-helix YgiT family protein
MPMLLKDVEKDTEPKSLPFPWQCHHCGEHRVELSTISYDAHVRHDGRLYEFNIPRLEIPVCQECGERVFSVRVDDQINDALRAHLQLLTPAQIQAALERLGLTQKEAAEKLGIAEATLSRWLTQTQIQSRAMDNLLRVFFAFPQVRQALSAESIGELGLTDVGEQTGAKRTSRNRVTA